MSKNIYEKWLEVEQKSLYDDYILEYYLSKFSKSRVYFGIIDKIKTIYIEFSKDALSMYECPKLKGLDIIIKDVKEISIEKRFLVIKNTSNNNEIFMAFSSSLCESILDLDNYFDVFNSIKSTIKEYKDYFSNQNKPLSQQEEQGLCAELLQLTYMVKQYGELMVKNWQGPFKNKRDFVFNKSALEVKSTLSQTNTNILISNENQLNCNYPDNLVNLYLKVFVFEIVDNGLTVTKCAKELLNNINDVNLKSIVKTNLLKLKVNIDIYESGYNFSLQTTKLYKITNEFPKIEKNMLSSEIFDVKYRLKIDSLAKFEIQEDEIIYE